MKLIFHFIILLGLFSPCHTQSYIYRQPVIGLLYDKIPLPDVSIVYDSSDALSPQNIITNKEGRFILPKIEMDNYADFISFVKRIQQRILLLIQNFSSLKIHSRSPLWAI